MIARRTPPPRLVAGADCLEFEPWKHSDGEWVPPSNAEYVDFRLSASRGAYSLAFALYAQH